MKTVVIVVASVALTFSASGQKSVDNPPGILLHGDGPRGTLEVILAGPDGEPARHVGVMVVRECPGACEIAASTTKGTGELEFDPITVGKYLVCSNLDIDASTPCFSNVTAASCTVEITPAYPEVELYMQVPKGGIAVDERPLCHQIAASSP